MSANVVAVVVGCFVALFGAVAAGLVSSLLTSKREQGKRIGSLEKWIDQEIGRQRGLAEAQHHRGEK